MICCGNQEMLQNINNVHAYKLLIIPLVDLKSWIIIVSSKDSPSIDEFISVQKSLYSTIKSTVYYQSKFQMSKQLHSIEEMLTFYKELEKPIYYMHRPRGNLMWNLNSYIPNFQIIYCSNLFERQIDFIRSPSKKRHQCLDSVKCQLQTFQDQDVIAYMKRKDQNPLVFYFKYDSETENICKKNKFKICGTSAQNFQSLGDKLKTSEIMREIEIPQIPYHLSKITSYSMLLEIGKSLFGTERLVVQLNEASTDEGTFFIHNQQDYNSKKQKMQQKSVLKIMPFYDLKSFAVNVITMKNGVILGPLMSQLIGEQLLATNPGCYCGNEIRKKYYQDEKLDMEIKEKVFQYATKIGRYIYDRFQYKGAFGIDFVVDISSNKLFFQEINPRVTGSTLLTNELFEVNGRKVPYMLFHFLEYLDVQLVIDFNQINKQFFNPQTYANQYTQMFFWARNQQELITKFNKQKFPCGIYTIKNQQLVFKQKLPLSFLNIKEEEYYIFAMQGYARGHIVCKGSTLDYNFKALNSSTKVMKIFLQKYEECLDKSNELQ